MTNPRAKEEFLKWIAYLVLHPADTTGIAHVRALGLAMYDEGYLAASCDRDAAFQKDLADLSAKYSWM